MPDTPDPQTRSAVTQRIIAHVARGWPRLGEPIVRHRGRLCYVSAVLPGHREPTPILRLRYQGSADRWAIGIYLASTGQYTESELPASVGPTTGTPEEAIDHAFILYAGTHRPALTPLMPLHHRKPSRGSAMSGPGAKRQSDPAESPRVSIRGSATRLQGKTSHEPRGDVP